VILGVEGVLLDFELPPTSLPGGRPSPNGWLVDELVNALPILYLLPEAQGEREGGEGGADSSGPKAAPYRSCGVPLWSALPNL